MEQHIDISGRTKTIALIGSPVEHSMSPAMHNAAFEHLGIDYVYTAYNVDLDDLETVAKAMSAMGFAGYNVTMPHKTFILPYLDELSHAAELMGAVNTVVITDGKAVGHNTDGAGFMRNLKENDVDVVGKKITMVGAGGAGSAIFTQAALDGVASIDVYNIRDDFFEATQNRVDELSQKTGCSITLTDLTNKDALRASVAESALFVNATRVGMAPLDDECTLSEDMLHDGLVVADTVYNPRVTKLLAMASARGNKTVSGLGMLLWQAALGEKLWTGHEMPVDYIEGRFFKA